MILHIFILLLDAMQELNDLIQISHFYGTNKAFVIAGGGNTSFKNATTLWVKASGVTLADIDEKGFAVLDRAKVKATLSQTYSTNPEKREEEVKNDLMASRLDPINGKRPSVEAALHEMIPFPFVVHTHPFTVNSITCSQQGSQTISRLFGNRAIFVEYTDPGYTLAKKMEVRMQEYHQKFNKIPQMIFLENHGVFIAADTTIAIQQIYEEIMTTIQKEFKTKADLKPIPLNPVINEISKIILSALQKYLPADAKLPITKAQNHNLLSRFYANNTQFQGIAQPFTPDNVMFCKAAPLFIEITSSPHHIVEKLPALLEQYLQKWGYTPRLFVLKNLGVIGIEDNEKAVQILLDFFDDVLQVSFYSQNFGGPKFLSRPAIDFIDHWEVEKYRKALSSK